MSAEQAVKTCALALVLLALLMFLHGCETIDRSTDPVVVAVVMEAADCKKLHMTFRGSGRDEQEAGVSIKAGPSVLLVPKAAEGVSK